MSTKSQAFGRFIGNSVGYAAGAAATSIVEVSGSLYTGTKDGYSAGRAGLTFAELRAATTFAAPALSAPVVETPVSIAIKRKTAKA